MKNEQKNPGDNAVYRFPVSVKGIIMHNDRVLLLKNERNEWELPGGKLELGEQPEICLQREVLEEVGFRVLPNQLIDIWVYTVFKDIHVLIVTYGCSDPGTANFIISNEHKEGAWFSVGEIKLINMPQGYKNSIEKW